MIALADVEDALVCLGGLHLGHPLGSLAALKGRITRHYVRQVLQVIYKVRAPLTITAFMALSWLGRSPLSGIRVALRSIVA